MLQRDSRIEALLQDLEDLEQQSTSERDRLNLKINVLSDQLTDEKLVTEQLNLKLAQAPSEVYVQNLLNQLRIVKAVEYGRDASDSSDGEVGISFDSEVLVNPSSLMDQALRQKILRLESECVQLKTERQHYITSLASLQQQVLEKSEKLNVQEALIAKLEADLDHHSSLSYFPSSNISQSPSQPSSDQQVLITLQNQRDRYKSKILQLESEKHLLEQRYAELCSKNDRLSSDNIQFYKKIKFLESYNNDSKPSSSSSSSSSSSLLPLSTSSRSKPFSSSSSFVDSTSRYQTIYEESINPFLEFSINEKSSRFADLNVAEKFAYYTGHFLTANKFTRAFLFFYTVFLHLLVLGTLYSLAGFSSSSSSNHSQFPIQLPEIPSNSKY